MICSFDLLVAVDLLIKITQLLGYVHGLRIWGELVNLERPTCSRLYPVYYSSVNLWVGRLFGRGRLLLHLKLVYLALWNWLSHVELLFDFWRLASHAQLLDIDCIQLTPAIYQLIVEERRSILAWRNNSKAGFPHLVSFSIRFGLWKIDRSILDRLSDDLCLVFLDSERGTWDLVDPTIFLLFCRFEAIFDAAHLPCLDLALANHLRAAGVSIRELLASPRLKSDTTDWLVVAHSRKPLLGNLSHIAASLIGEAYFVGLSWLYELRLVHDLSDLRLQETVWVYSCSRSTTRIWSMYGVVAGRAERWWRFLRGILLFAIATIIARVLFESGLFSFLTVWEEVLWVLLLHVSVIIVLRLLKLLLRCE